MAIAFIKMACSELRDGGLHVGKIQRKGFLLETPVGGCLNHGRLWSVARAAAGEGDIGDWVMDESSA